ncbi:DeoR family transcriptional regulator, glycerol-3-phosphate regulon repressor [Paracoccus isoporae]|uniref:DeoR family transcriptional regulator, glycerol-3-phosphate regulon repressor n=1 Tax=Paracoccus isoporae TaxID=591205 RepID=A0A1G6ZIS2_9RHOB|nr:DeoR/GlpR family DNA-binding transcription regulator [Paracoccus isoporae]SDE02644.1 DeoR family transcriptional regulator, glycerol-3-phosphate regulon repressor [Paracoccus isoporae]
MNVNDGRKLPATLRRKEIMSALERNGHVTIVDIAEQLRVSDMTVRRDLELLAEDNLLVRTHGGAHLPEIFQERPLERHEPSAASRASVHREEKQKIARTARRYIEPHMTIALDIGTTMQELTALIDDVSVRVVSTSLRVQQDLAERQMTIFVPPGKLGGPEPSISGAQTIAYLQNFHFDAVFLGVAGITLDGSFDYSIEDAEIKKALIQRSSRRILLADSSKFGAVSAVRVTGFDVIDVLVTDAEPPGPLKTRLEAAGTEIVVTRP